jgi:hypothetical protein
VESGVVVGVRLPHQSLRKTQLPLHSILQIIKRLPGVSPDLPSSPPPLPNGTVELLAAGWKAGQSEPNLTQE